MRARMRLVCRLVAVLVAIPALVPGMAAEAHAQAPPTYMNLITAHPTMTGAQVAEQNVLDLNVAKFGYYERALRQYQRNLLAQHPVILALFSGAGGDLTLYRPEVVPLRAPSVPLVYQLLKSVAHSSMAVFQIAGPHLGPPADQSWRALMEVDRTQHRLALDSLASVDMDPSWRDNLRIILTNNVAYLDAALARNAIDYADLHAFARKQAPYLARNVAWAAEVQVPFGAHEWPWMVTAGPGPATIQQLLSP